MTSRSGPGFNATRAYGTSQGPTWTDASPAPAGGGGSGGRRRRGRRARRLREHDDADRRLQRRRAPTSSSRSPPARAACRCRAPTTASRGRSPTTTSRSPTGFPTRADRCRSTTTPTTSTRRSSSSFEKHTGRQVEIATYNSADEAVAKLAAGAVGFDVIIGLSGSNIVNLIAQQLLQPLNHSYLPNLREEHLARAAGPVLRPRQPLHGPVRRLVGRDRLAQRQDLDRHRRRWTSPGTSSGSRSPTGARSRSSTTSATRSAMPMQRDAMRTGRRPDLNTEDEAIVATAGEDLQQLTDIANVKVTITDYQTLPEGKTWLHQSGPAISSARPSTTCRRACRRASSRTGRPTRTASSRTTSSASAGRAKNPALAHRFIDFFLDEKIAYQQLRQPERLHAAAEVDRRRRR